LELEPRQRPTLAQPEYRGLGADPQPGKCAATYQRCHTRTSDPVFLTQLQQVVDARRYYLLDPGWYSRTYLNQPDKPNTGVRGIAYFSMEFGICDALPLYAGGLGILAGDYLKTASDLGLPLVGIGLLYQEGYFRQSMNRDGWQEETYL
jgi:starch phosphorylase